MFNTPGRKMSLSCGNEGFSRRPSAKKKGAFIQAWLRAGMVPEDVLEIVGSSSGERIMWLDSPSCTGRKWVLNLL
uniref:Uncharacterized protein n=1 Tax=Hyaloperonospora arabidopsidis (strain Emoy2) TaxID=559515 RepID=M4B4S2_HYAAE